MKPTPVDYVTIVLYALAVCVATAFGFYAARFCFARVWGAR